MEPNIWVCLSLRWLPFLWWFKRGTTRNKHHVWGSHHGCWRCDNPVFRPAKQLEKMQLGGMSAQKDLGCSKVDKADGLPEGNPTIALQTENHEAWRCVRQTAGGFQPQPDHPIPSKCSRSALACQAAIALGSPSSNLARATPSIGWPKQVLTGRFPDPLLNVQLLAV